MKKADIDWQQGAPQSREFDDCYFSSEGGIEETEYVFLQQNELPERWKDTKAFVVAETGFGTGLNFLVTANAFLSTSDKNSKLYYYSVEKFPLSKSDLSKALNKWPSLSQLVNELIDNFPPPIPGFHRLSLYENSIQLILLQGDINSMLPQMNCLVDAWYLDGFAPDKNPEMWSEEVFKNIAELSHRGTQLSTYTVAGHVRRGLVSAGFQVKKVKGFGKKRHMIKAMFEAENTKTVSLPWFNPAPTYDASRITIIGAGIAGLTTAWELVQRGYQVNIIDKENDVAQQASGNPAAIVMPRIGINNSVENEFYATAFLQAIRQLKAIDAAIEDFSWHQCGVIQLSSNERLTKLIQKNEHIDDFSLPLSASEASKQAGIELQENGLLLPTAGWVDAPLLCKALQQLCGDNIQFYSNINIQRLDYSNDTWSIYDSDNRCITESETVVLCNAADCMQLEQSKWLSLESVRGQISYLAVKEIADLQCVICHDGYVTPAMDGIHIVGATFSINDKSMNVSVADHEDNINSLQQHIADVKGINVDALQGRVSRRAVTADRLPMIGALADNDFFNTHYHDLHKGKKPDSYPSAKYHPGLYVNTGHGSRGITSSFLTAQWLASQINNEPSTLSRRVQQALNPSRFIIRQLKKKITNE